MSESFQKLTETMRQALVSQSYDFGKGLRKQYLDTRSMSSFISHLGYITYINNGPGRGLNMEIETVDTTKQSGQLELIIGKGY